MLSATGNEDDSRAKKRARTENGRVEKGNEAVETQKVPTSLPNPFAETFRTFSGLIKEDRVLLVSSGARDRALCLMRTRASRADVRESMGLGRMNDPGRFAVHPGRPVVVMQESEGHFSILAVYAEEEVSYRALHYDLEQGPNGTALHADVSSNTLDLLVTVGIITQGRRREISVPKDYDATAGEDEWKIVNATLLCLRKSLEDDRHALGISEKVMRILRSIRARVRDGQGVPRAAASGTTIIK